MSLRGTLRGFGLKVGRTTTRTFAARVCELVSGHPTLAMIADALLSARTILAAQLHRLEKRVIAVAREDARVRLLMSTPGVGLIVALTYVAAIDDPSRHHRSRVWRCDWGSVRECASQKVALARKLAVVLHRMLADGTAFIANKAAAAPA